MNPNSLPVLAALLAGLPLAAQNLLSYRPDGGAGIPPRMIEYPCLSRAWDGVAGPGLVPGPFPGRARPFAGALLGASAIDALAGVMFTTNGVATIQRTQYPRIGASTGAAIPDLPIPAAVGQVTGMAVDPVLHHLFLTNGIQIFEVDPMAGMAVLGSFLAAPLNILTGLEYDRTQPGVIFAVSSAAEVAVYNRGGGLVGVTPAPYGWPGADAIGVALDMSDVGGGDFYVLHANGQLWNHTRGVLHATEAANQVGMCYLPSPVHLPSVGSCGGVVPTVETTNLVVDGLANIGLEVHNLPPGTGSLVWLLQPLPPGAAPALLTGLPLPGGDTVWPALGGPSLFTFVGGAADSVRPFAVPAGFAGWSILAQPFMMCPAAAAGFIAPQAMQLEISRD
ncbi:MAG: hypothetical protein U1E73_12970 [Planctomycetota bacterium]